MTDPTVCLLHADIHVMGPECWNTTTQWWFDHQDMPETERRDAYQTAAERRMLNALTTEG